MIKQLINLLVFGARNYMDGCKDIMLINNIEFTE